MASQGLKNNIYLSFSGRNKHIVEVPLDSQLSVLMSKVEEITGIPSAGQKLICQAKTLTVNNPELTTLKDLNLVNGSKVMVLGRKFDPEQDESYKQILAIEKRTLDIMQKFAEVIY